ncbi:IclR family transcriptional regulator [Saliphagus infecundisoli]|uniref:IclR family transcriptional regulator n=1 Tax=Saliphagus infecundisoli TaxID=1849069 RepID=A0ABD5QAW7_9EURY|nr:IclR family transcriptional regulator [Saliphagus infecundisoli]
MGKQDTTKKSIKSTQTAFDIIETIANRDRPTVTEIASAVEHSRSTVHYHLKTLKRNRYVIQDDDGLRLGLRMTGLGDIARQQHGLSGVVEESADNLAREADADACVAVKERNKLVWLYRATNRDLSEFPADPGRETTIHSTAYGQAILAYTSTETVDMIVESQGLPAETERTLRTREKLDKRLSMVRELGVAYSSEEHTEGISSIAAPILDESTDEVLGAIGISNHHDEINDPYKHPKAQRFSDELPRLVKQTAQIASNAVPDSGDRE